MTGLWTELRANRPNLDDVLETRPVVWKGEDVGILAGIDVQGDLHLLIPVNGEPRSPEPADLTGLKVRRRLIGPRLHLGLVAAAPHEAVFTPFCRQVLEAIVEQKRDPWSAVSSIIRQWRSAFTPSREQMSVQAQVGLAGELIILDRIMIPVLGSRAVLQWSGPIRERHDFVSSRLNLEVKTTRGSRPEHRISRLDQLWSPEGRHLLLASVQLEVSIAGGTTLATLIDGIVDQLRFDSEASEDFLSKLSALDWSDEMRRSGELIRFNLRNATLYEVDDEFPRFSEGFAPPRGVFDIRFTVDLANLPTLDIGEVMEMIRLANEELLPA